MGISIEDGTGHGNQAMVDADNHLHVRAETSDLLQAASINSLSYNMSTTSINLTSANESGIVYIKNNDTTRDLIIGRSIVTLGASTGGGTGDAILRAYRTPTGGTLLAGTAITPLNRNFGSVVPADVDARQGAEGSTITGATLLSTLIMRAASLLTFQLELVVPAGTAFAVSFQPAAGNTSMNVAFVNVTALVTPGTV